MVRSAHAGAHLQVSDGEFVQAATLVAQSAHQSAERPVAAHRQPGSSRTNGERQAAAQPHDPRRGIRFGVDSPPSRQGGEQLDRGVLVQNVEIGEMGTGHPREPGTRCDQNRAAGPSRQERSNLAFRTGVVEYDQDTSPREDAAIHVDAFLE
jgi:hypothetical protein